MLDTINYYNRNAEKFTSNTVYVDLSHTQNHFISKLSEGAHILDFGCGSGRDAKYFLDNGYVVTAIDGSNELCKLASEHTGLNVRQMLFEDLRDVDIYNGIWACSSILHLSTEELIPVLQQMEISLKNNGIIYTSFKYGDYERTRNSRHFTDMTEDKFKYILKSVEHLVIKEEWITSDARPERREERWLNFLLRKK